MLTAVVISFNRRECLRRCLDGFYAQRGGVPFEIVVIDQGSTDGSLDLVRSDQARHPELRLDVLPDPSLNAKRNRGLELARYDRVAFIDDDAVPDPDWIAALARAFAAPGRAIVTGSVLPLTPGYRRTVRDDPRPRLWQNRFLDKLVIWRCGCGTNMAVSRACVEKIGTFDPAVGTGTALGGCGDEVDYFLRALDAGLAIQYDPAVRVHHHQSADPAVLERRMWNYYYGIAVLMRRKYARHPVARPMMALRLGHAACLLAAHALLFRRDLVRGDLCAIRGTVKGWFGAQPASVVARVS
jgi:glycosyltransferase involved in cell wall biosynthesis